MKIECVNCHENFEVPDGLAVGQHVRCPFCHEKSQIDAPSRIMLPEGFETRRRFDAKPATQPPEEASNAHAQPAPSPAPSPASSSVEPSAEPPVPELPAKPKLSIRRPANLPPPGAHVPATENPLVTAFERRDRSRRRVLFWRAVKKGVGRIFALAVLAALAWIGFGVWRNIQRDDAQPTPSRSTEVAAEERSADSTEQARIQEEERQRAEAEQRAAADAERLRNRYGTLVDAFKGAKLSFWNLMPKEVRPGAANGVMYVMVPRTRAHQELYEVTTSNKTISVRFVSSSDAGREVARETFLKSLSANGGVFLLGGVAYAFRAKAKGTWSAPLDGRAFNPAENFLGDLPALLDSLGVDSRDVAYKVKMSFGDKTEPIDLATVAHGQTIPVEAFRKVAEDRARELRLKSVPEHLTAKRFVPTVTFYDGAYVAKDTRGHVKVPRHWRQSGARGHAEWLDYYREAQRQQFEMEKSERAIALERKAWTEKVKGPPERQRVDAVLASADVLINATVKGGAQ